MTIVFFYAVLGGMKGITYTPGGAILCINLCLHGAGRIYFHPDDGQYYSPDWLWLGT